MGLMVFDFLDFEGASASFCCFASSLAVAVSFKTNPCTLWPWVVVNADRIDVVGVVVIVYSGVVGIDDVGNVVVVDGVGVVVVQVCVVVVVVVAVVGVCVGVVVVVDAVVVVGGVGVVDVVVVVGISCVCGRCCCCRCGRCCCLWCCC